MKVQIEGITGEGIIWEEDMPAIPRVGDIVVWNNEEQTRDVRTVFFDLDDDTVLIRVR